MFNEGAEFVFEVLEPGLALKGFVVTEEGDDGVGLKTGEPLIGGGHGAGAGVARAPAVGRFRKGWVEFFSTGKGPGIWAGGMGPEAGGIAFITHVADDEMFLRVEEMEGCLENAVLHHARAEAVAEKDDVVVFADSEGDCGAGNNAEEENEEGLHVMQNTEVVVRINLEIFREMGEYDLFRKNMLFLCADILTARE